jgi:hypothetical protein
MADIDINVGVNSAGASASLNYLKKMSSTFADEAVSKIAGLVGAAAVAKMAFDKVSEAMSKNAAMAKQIGGLSAKFHIDPKEVHSLLLAANDAGVSVRSLLMGMKSLGAQASKALINKDQMNVFKQLGMDVDKVGDMANKPAKQFAELAKSLMEIDNETDRAAYGTKLLGRQYQQMIPLIESLGASAEAREKFLENENAMTNEQIQSQRTMAKIQSEMEESWLKLVALLAPALLQLTSFLGLLVESLAKSDGILEKWKAINTEMKAASSAKAQADQKQYEADVKDYKKNKILWSEMAQKHGATSPEAMAMLDKLRVFEAGKVKEGTGAGTGKQAEFINEYKDLDAQKKDAAAEATLQEDSAAMMAEKKEREIKELAEKRRNFGKAAPGKSQKQVRDEQAALFKIQSGGAYADVAPENQWMLEAGYSHAYARDPEAGKKRGSSSGFNDAMNYFNHAIKHGLLNGPTSLFTESGAGYGMTTAEQKAMVEYFDLERKINQSRKEADSFKGVGNVDAIAAKDAKEAKVARANKNKASKRYNELFLQTFGIKNMYVDEEGNFQEGIKPVAKGYLREVEDVDAPKKEKERKKRERAEKRALNQQRTEAGTVEAAQLKLIYAQEDAQSWQEEEVDPKEAALAGAQERYNAVKAEKERIENDFNQTKFGEKYGSDLDIREEISAEEVKRSTYQPGEEGGEVGTTKAGTRLAFREEFQAAQEVYKNARRELETAIADNSKAQMEMIKLNNDMIAKRTALWQAEKEAKLDLMAMDEDNETRIHNRKLKMMGYEGRTKNEIAKEDFIFQMQKLKEYNDEYEAAFKAAKDAASPGGGKISPEEEKQLKELRGKVLKQGTTTEAAAYKAIETKGWSVESSMRSIGGGGLQIGVNDSVEIQQLDILKDQLAEAKALPEKLAALIGLKKGEKTDTTPSTYAGPKGASPVK